MRQRFRSRLHYKLMLGFSAVLLPALVIISLYTQLSTREMLLALARDEQFHLAANRVAAAEGLLAEIGTDLRFLAVAPDLNSYVADDTRADPPGKLRLRLLDFLAASGQRYAGICLTDPQGNAHTCAQVRQGQPEIVTADAPILQGQPDPPPTIDWRFERPPITISGPIVLPLPGPGGAPPQVLRYQSALYSDAGQLIGTLILYVHTQPIIDLLVDTDANAHTTIVDGRGAYVLGPASGSLRDVRPTSAAQILTQPHGTIPGAPDQPGTFTTFQAVRFPAPSAISWVVIYDKPVANVLIPINTTLATNIALSIGLLLIGLLLTYGLTRSIVRPMRVLAEAAEQIGAGDLLAPIVIDSPDEIGALARTLNHTVGQLRSTLESAEARRREAETLYSTAIALNATLDLHQLLDRILDELRKVVPYDSSTVQLARGDQVEIIGAYGLAKTEELIGARFPLAGAGPNAEVARRRATVILDDAPTVYERFNEEPYRADPIRSWLGVPLIFGERLVGMITIDKYEPGFYTPEHARITSAFAAQAAIALENARLYEAARDELAERRRSEQALMRLSAILEATTDLVGSADTEGRLLFLNHAGRRLLGFGADAELLGRPIQTFLPEQMLDKLRREGIPAAMRDGIWSGEIAVRQPGGREIPASQVIIAHRDAAGNTEYFSTIVRDISERLRAEEQLRQAQKMEAVGRLAGGVSHDFNNILTVIMGECDLMLHEPGLRPELREGIDQIRQAGIRAAALTRQLLAFSRRQVLQPATINLNEIIAPIEQMLRRLIGENITLQTRLSNDLAAVRADPSQIEQVILNLCINGRDAMPNGGELTIITENVSVGPGELDDLAHGDYVLLTVRDTGTGIDEGTREHIFEPFFTTKPRGKGTGLGLATVHGIVTQSGGTIRFSSLPSQGTSFYTYLPAVCDDQLPSGHLHTERPAFTKAVVLLVEDDERVRRLAQQILAGQGLTVIEAPDGASALQIADRRPGPIDILLSDVVMPGGVNGAQLAERLRAERPQIKVLLMSGYTDDALSASGGFGADTHFIQKPFSASQLLDKLHETLG